MALLYPEQVLLRYKATDNELDPSHSVKLFLVPLLSDKLLSQGFIIGLFVVESTAIEQVHDGLLHGSLVATGEKGPSHRLWNVYISLTLIGLVDIGVRSWNLSSIRHFDL